jgi:hypothetical protein
VPTKGKPWTLGERFFWAVVRTFALCLALAIVLYIAA